MDLKGLPAIVTGGASGLGLATARMLRQRGAKVAIFDLKEEEGVACAGEIGASFHQVDVSDDLSVARAVDAAAAQNGIARLLVNCAGVALPGRTVGRDGQAHDLDRFRRTIDVNLVGTFNAIAKFAARLVAADIAEEDKGLIINTASVAAFDGQIGTAAYTASKAGVAGMTLSLARDLAEHRIRVMSIAPGVFLTPMVESFSPQVQNSLAAQVPHPRRLGQPSEYAQLVLAIASNPMLNGETVRLDGAVRLGPR
ncbi:3-hydroxyacyl-CoA dehydrogenase [Sphingobium sp. TA15]|uniref:SDR-family protein n=1 Tax=Sphingobium indicum (strain DSM 16413 / CCM 7287 / MTCC 6362 / UT26 / NBRC 101211 / UT26S) TaxID=452662 RepID=D4Z0S5_SPHIU|nr:SDR family NAD(P)-dependent oxidoreductase [Sphingobium indicum]BAI96207.1 SDR-family protein [Sphingobium indicum UT26S]BDD65508.1 3-hydroxyacyl-CoA dehydrogenase [Sphingobium sp. TA15]